MANTEMQKLAALREIARLLQIRSELKAEVAQLREDLREMGATLQAEIKCGDALGTRLEAKAVLLREFRAAVREFYGDPQEAAFDTPETTRINEVLRRVDAEMSNYRFGSCRSCEQDPCTCPSPYDRIKTLEADLAESRADHEATRKNWDLATKNWEALVERLTAELDEAKLQRAAGEEK